MLHCVSMQAWQSAGVASPVQNELSWQTAAQAAWLVANGCDELQGNYFSLPVPATEFARLYARGKTWHLPPTASAAHAHGS